MEYFFFFYTTSSLKISCKKVEAIKFDLVGERPTSYTKCFQISLRLAPEERLHRLKRQLRFGNFQNGITSTIWFPYRNFRFPSLYGINPWITNYGSVTSDAGTPIRMIIMCNLADNWKG